MADNDALDDLDNDENDQEQQKPKRNFLMIGLVALVGLLLVALSITGTLLAVKLTEPDTQAITPVQAETQVDTPAVAEEPAPDSDETSSDDEAAEPKKTAIYYSIKPPIIVNFDARGRQRFLQAELALMTREDDVISTIETHMSMIRNNLILLIGSHLFEDLQTAEGKELLRQQCLQELQRLLEKEIGKPGIEQVLFTNFVMQ